LLKKCLLWLEKRIYSSAVAIVALSPGMADGIHKVLGPIPKEVLLAPNSSDTQLFHPEVDGSQIRSQQGWQDKFIVLHFGAMGRANGLDFLIDAAQRIKDNCSIHFVLMGGGSEKQRIRTKIKELGLTNIDIMDTFPKKEMPQIVAASDISTVIFSNFPVLEHNSANKFFDSLSAGKPILLNYGGWQKEKIERNECGYGCKQGDLDEYVEKLYIYLIKGINFQSWGKKPVNSLKRSLIGTLFRIAFSP
ncbi:MAG: glycosyltransferase family 4 protein, partial [Planctomycetota bacterium]